MRQRLSKFARWCEEGEGFIFLGIVAVIAGIALVGGMIASGDDDTPDDTDCIVTSVEDCDGEDGDGEG